MLGQIEGHLPGEVVVARHAKQGHAQHRGQPKPCRAGAQHARGTRQVAVLAGQLSAQAQRAQHNGQKHAQRKCVRRVHAAQGKSTDGRQKLPDGHARAFLDVKGDHGGGFALGIYAFDDGFMNRRALKRRGGGFGFGAGLQVALVAHKGIARTLGEHHCGKLQRREECQNDGHKQRRGAQPQGVEIAFCGGRTGHSSSSFRMVIVMYRPAAAHRIRKPITESAVACPFFWS